MINENGANLDPPPAAAAAAPEAKLHCDRMKSSCTRSSPAFAAKRTRTHGREERRDGDGDELMDGGARTFFELSLL